MLRSPLCRLKVDPHEKFNFKPDVMKSFLDGSNSPNRRVYALGPKTSKAS